MPSKIFGYVFFVYPNVLFLNIWLVRVFSNTVPFEFDVCVFWGRFTSYCFLVVYCSHVCEKKSVAYI